MTKLPESTRLAYARQLADEAKTLVPGMERLSAIARELRTDDLYRLLGFDTWERFCVDYLGVSKWTANRWISGDKPKSIGAGQSVAAVQDAPIVESDTLKSDKSPEGVDQRVHTEPTRSGGAVSASASPTPSGPSSAGGLVSEQTPSPSADPSSGGARTTAPPRLAPTDEAPASPGPAPLDPPEAPVWYGADEATAWQNGYSAALAEQGKPVDVDAIGLRWLKSKTTREIRAIGDPWGPAIRSEVRRWAEAFGAPPAPAENTDGWLPTPEELAGRAPKPQRRQGTITRPADRAPKPPVKVNGAPMGNLTRRDVTPMFKP